jgi:peptidoglycan/LPS O-acetylase OafA/YrhL
VLFVVCFHAGLPVPGGFVGVDVFFVISGFVITSMLSREHGASGRIRFGAFYARRFRRLAPALALVVSVTVLVSSLVVSTFQAQQNTAKTGIGAMLLYSNFAIAHSTGGYFDVAADTNPLLHTWSLSVEEQFYVVFPALLALGWLASRRRRSLRYAGPALAAAAIGTASFLYAVKTAGDVRAAHLGLQGFYAPTTRAWEFAAGAVLALVGGWTALSKGMQTVLAFIGLAMLGASLWLITRSTPFPGYATLLPVLGTVFVIGAGLRSGNVVTRLLGSRRLVALGDRSYSWYLWHWPLIVFSGFLWPGSRPAAVGAAVLSLGPASACYRWVEQPVRSMKAVTGRRIALVAALCLVPAIALSASLLAAANSKFWSPRIKALEAAIGPLHAAAVAGCTSGAPSERVSGRCEWNAASRGRPVYVIGDSNVEQFSEAVIDAGRQLDRPVRISTFNGCAFLGASWSDVPDAAAVACRAYVEGTIRSFQNRPAGLVVIGFTDARWLQRNLAVGPTRDRESTDHAARDRYLEADLASIVSRLQKTGQEVLLLQPIPKPWRIDRGTIKPLYYPHHCTTISVLWVGCPKPVRLTRTYMDRLQADPRVTIRRVAAATGAKVLDFRAFFCPRNICSTHQGDGVLYRDDGHITVRTSTALAPAFARAIGRAP